MTRLKMVGRSVGGCMLGCWILTAAVSCYAASENIPFPGQSHTVSGVMAGQLTCNVQGNWSFIFGSVRRLDCSFATTKGPVYHYVGRISKYGLDIGYLKGGTMTWDVYIPTLDFEPAGLDGDYIGVEAGVAASSGGEANILVGGSGRSISLQPVSVMGTEGVNLAVGVAGISFQYRP